jgi:hypothetical protein
MFLLWTLIILYKSHGLRFQNQRGLFIPRKLRQCLPNPLTGERELDLEAEYGHTEESQSQEYRQSSLRQALERVNNLFKNAKCYRKSTTKANEKFAEDAKKVYIITNQDDPCRGDEQEKTILRNCAADARNGGCQLLVLPLRSSSNASRPFHGDKIYNDIAETPEHLQYNDNGSLDLDVLLFREMKVARRSFSIPLLLPDHISTGLKNSEDKKRDSIDSGKANRKEEKLYPEIMLDFFRPVHKQHPPSKVKVLREMGP